MPLERPRNTNPMHEQFRRQSIGRAIKDRRVEMEWTSKMLAEAAAMTPSSISRLERGTVAPSYQRLGRVLKVLNLNETEFLGSIADAVQTGDRLNAVLEQLDVPEPARSEARGLSLTTLAALLTAFDVAANRAFHGELDRPNAS